MQSFRTELENTVVEKDIIELERKIRLFKDGKLDEDKFRSLRLARGVYGQRQSGVQMIRIKLPYGKTKVNQLLRIADVADEYSTGKLHITTRQDIQIHYVSLDRTPQLWAELEKDDVTLREACGNTVRNVTASALAGVEKDEPFDVSPYAHAMFDFFLRNPISQEMGRKVKIAFSSNEEDSAYTFIHDIGFIAKTKTVDNIEYRGFKVVIAGGLGAQPYLAHTVYDFLPEDLIIPYSEALVRVFDKHGERARRNKARLKYLVKKIGVEEFQRLVELERKALRYQTFHIDHEAYEECNRPEPLAEEVSVEVDTVDYKKWFDSNVVAQKQSGYYAVNVRLLTGDFTTTQARSLAKIIQKLASDEIRFTIAQGFVIKFVPEANLKLLYKELDKLGFAEPGADSTHDVTACPGTDTCNLGIANSTGVAGVLENVLRDDYPDYIYNKNLKIKISGCMNSCGQHSMAAIGYHGSAIKVKQRILPAVQILLGGGVLSDGEGRISDKIVKIPSKRVALSLKTILDDYETHSNEGEYHIDYYQRQGKAYFYDLLKGLASTDDLVDTDFIDWGREEYFKTEVGVGECAGVTIDLVATLLLESEERIASAIEALEAEAYADSIYHTYSSLVNTAKALLVSEGLKTNTQAMIIKDFDEKYPNKAHFKLEKSFQETTYAINENEPTKDFALSYLAFAKEFVKDAFVLREQKDEQAN